MSESFSFEEMYRIPAEELRPTAREWLRHSLWFLLTLLTTTIGGLVPPLGSGVDIGNFPMPSQWFEWLFVVPNFYSYLFVQIVTQVAANPYLILHGLMFSGSLLTILTFHEFGHYIAARLYGVKTSLPFFIPTPPMIGVGTLGAVIRMRSPMPTQRAIFDIGVAGPLAGFAAIVPIMLFGLSLMPQLPPSVTGGETFADPLLARLLGALIGIDPARGVMNPFYEAAWFGTLITSLNLLPVSQLDGGHAVFAIFGERIHFWTGRIAFAAMVTLTIVSWELYGTPSTLVFTILLAFFLRLPHPEPLFDRPLDAKRKLIAVLTLIVFALSFMPFPIQAN